MTTILHIDSSILGGYSVSRTLTSEIVARQQALHHDARIIRRDLVIDAAMHLSDAHLAVFQGGDVGSPALDQDLATGSAYIDDLFAADIIVIGAPMYNFAIPTQLKGWIDRVLVAGRTFQYGANGPEGLVTGKKVFIASARGGVYTGNSPAAGLDHQETYLLGVLAFIGLTDVTIVRAEGLAMGEDVKAAAIAGAKAQIEALAASSFHHRHHQPSSRTCNVLDQHRRQLRPVPAAGGPVPGSGQASRPCAGNAQGRHSRDGLRRRHGRRGGRCLFPRMGLYGHRDRPRTRLAESDAPSSMRPVRCDAQPAGRLSDP